MFHVHPDKFSTSDTTSESATDITVKKIDRYIPKRNFRGTSRVLRLYFKQRGKS